MSLTSRTLRLALVGGALALTTVTAVSCSSQQGSADSADSAGSSGSSGDSSSSLAGSAPVAGSAGDSEQVSDGDGSQAGRLVDADRAVISTGNVELRAKDVAAAVFGVQKIVDQVRGQVSERSSATDDDGDLRTARLVLRVPAAGFDDTMQLLGAPAAGAELISSDSTSEDVTTQVIDTDVRVGVQQASIDRIKLLLARAGSIKDIVAIESQLSQREADLGSLQQQQTYLADQTTMATITLSVERPSAANRSDEERSGFLGGLSSGWDALSGLGTGVATVAGALLPWLVVALVLAVPGVPLARRLRRRTPTAPGPTAPGTT